MIGMKRLRMVIVVVIVLVSAACSAAGRPTGGTGLTNRFLRRAIDCGRPHKTWRDLVLDFMQQSSDPAYDNSANWVSLLGKIQSLQRR